MHILRYENMYASISIMFQSNPKNMRTSLHTYHHNSKQIIYFT
uniref:Uncharacterized protein n=1 Tax=Arundo donax TaxID=35708 RepID=A0A0A9D682_ARUDO